MTDTPRIQSNDSDHTRQNFILNELAKRIAELAFASDADYLAGTANKIITADNLLAAPAFYAHNNGTGQTGLTSAVYNAVSFTNSFYNFGSVFTAGATPSVLMPAGVISMKGQIRQATHALSTGSFVAKVIRVRNPVGISNGSPCVITWPTHLMTADRPVSFLSVGGSLPSGLSTGEIYVKTVLSADTFTVASTVGGSAINTSTAGSGTFIGFVDEFSGITDGAVSGSVAVKFAGDYRSNGLDPVVLNYFQTDDGTAGTLDGHWIHHNWQGHWVRPLQ